MWNVSRYSYGCFSLGFIQFNVIFPGRKLDILFCRGTYRVWDWPLFTNGVGRFLNLGILGLQDRLSAFKIIKLSRQPATGEKIYHLNATCTLRLALPIIGKAKSAKPTVDSPSTLVMPIRSHNKCSTEEDLLIMAACAVIVIDGDEKLRERRKRRFSVRPSLESRRARCGTNDLMKDFRIWTTIWTNQITNTGPVAKNFFFFFGINTCNFEMLLNNSCSPKIKNEELFLPTNESSSYV